MFSVVCALLIVGVITALVINVNYITQNIEDSLEVKVYLDDNITTTQQEEIYKKLINYEIVESVTYQSKAEALESFAQTLGEENRSYLSTYTPDNSPFPAAYIVKITDTSRIKEIYELTIDMPGVQDVNYGEKTVTSLLSFNSFVNTLSIIIFVVLSLIAVFIIYNTIKITVFSRRSEISIMKYIGATDWYIRFPFIIEGSILGLLGAVVAILLIRNLYYFLIGYILGSASLITLGSSLAPASMVIGRISIYFILYGLVLGSVGSGFSIKKFLHV